MNMLDRIAGVISPRWQAARLRYRQSIKAYEAGSATRTFKPRREWRTADQLTQFAGKSLREQARWLDDNHDLVIGALDKMEERIIGAKGIIVEPHPQTRAGVYDGGLADTIRRAWGEWSVAPDVTGTYTRPVLERLLLRTWLRDGEVFVQTISGRAKGLKRADVPFWIEALEPDFVPLDLNDPLTGTVQGITLNSWRKPEKYTVYKTYPTGLTGLTGDQTKRIDAADMLHLKLTRRLHQVRGVSLLAGVIIRLSDLKDYEDSERIAARLASRMAMFIKRSDAMLTDGQDFDPQADGRELDIEPGTILKNLLPGEDVGTVKSDRPNPNLETFRTGQIRAFAAGTRSSASSVSRNYNGTYSAQRQELTEAQEGYHVLQDDFIAAVSRPLYRRWLAAAIASGVIEVPVTTDRSTLFDAIYSGPVMPWIDPLKEAESWQIQIRGGAATEADWARARGASPADVKKRRKAETDENRKLGLIFDTDAANDIKAHKYSKEKIHDD